MPLCSHKPKRNCSHFWQKISLNITKREHESSPDKSNFFLIRIRLLGHIIEKITITTLKSRIDATQKLQPPTNKLKIQKLLGMLIFLGKDVYKMQLYLRPSDNILRQQNSFDWTTEHQTQFEEIKKLLTEQISNTIPDPNQPFMQCAMLQFLASMQLYYNPTMERKK